MTLKEKYKKEILKYGFLPLLILIEKYKLEEKYELCQAITEAISEHGNKYNVLVHKVLSKDAVEDAVAAFWELGLSGDKYLANSMYYAYEIEKSIPV